VKYGSLICFEIAIPELSRDLVSQGAEVLLAQSNNSDFGHSDETYQQGALARLRAIETGRPVVYVSTVGVSAVYLPNGEIANQITPFKPGAFVARIPLSKSITPAVALGWAPDIAFGLISAALLMLALASRNRRKDI
jgi:apolipoprotein N-acyltransferase